MHCEGLTLKIKKVIGVALLNSSNTCMKYMVCLSPTYTNLIITNLDSVYSEKIEFLYYLCSTFLCRDFLNLIGCKLEPATVSCFVLSFCAKVPFSMKLLMLSMYPLLTAIRHDSDLAGQLISFVLLYNAT